MGVPLELQGVARQFKFSEEKEKGQTLGVPLESQAWHANAQPITRRATWYRRRVMPAIIPHLGVPLESQTWHTSTITQQREDWACHLSSRRGTPTKGSSTHKGAWHARPWVCHASSTLQRRNQAHIRGVARQTLGVPR
ncbi:hypothetical protein AHAS_Ahas18G0166500 [Arachis hypogaea]